MTDPFGKRRIVDPRSDAKQIHTRGLVDIFHGIPELRITLEPSHLAIPYCFPALISALPVGDHLFNRIIQLVASPVGPDNLRPWGRSCIIEDRLIVGHTSGQATASINILVVSQSPLEFSCN